MPRDEERELARALLMPTVEFPGPSPRMLFQWNCLKRYWPGEILNVGCADDPLHFGPRCTHLDIDDWSAYFAKIGAPFVQGDVQELTKVVGDESFDLVIMGDTLEHIPDPLRALYEIARVARRAICLTVWEELRLSGPGRHIEEGQARADEEVQRLGYQDRFDHQRALYPEKGGFDDVAMPHLIHIWQFTDEMIAGYVRALEMTFAWTCRVFVKVPEVVTDGQQFYNWLVLLEKEDSNDTIR